MSRLPEPRNLLEGPVYLTVVFEFPYRKAEPKKNREGFKFLHKDTKPDTDNMVKLVKDAIGEAGFWKDDAQVAHELVAKRWGPEPGVHILLGPLENPIAK